MKWKKTYLIVIQFLSVFGLQWAPSCSKDLISIQRYQVTVNNDGSFRLESRMHPFGSQSVPNTNWAICLAWVFHSTPFVQSRSFNKLWNLGQTKAYFFFGKVQKVHRTLTNPFYNLEISIWVKILNQILNLMSYLKKYRSWMKFLDSSLSEPDVMSSSFILIKYP